MYVYVDASSEATTDGVHSTGGAADELLERTEELITTLREQLQAERQAHAEARRLLAAALERIPPQLPAPEDASESPQPRPDRTATADASGEPETGSRRPWWRRWLEG